MVSLKVDSCSYGVNTNLLNFHTDTKLRYPHDVIVPCAMIVYVAGEM